MLWEGLQNHTFRHTVFCQDGNPSIGLSESYDEDQLFYDFSQNTRVPRLPDFADWAQEQGDASAISFDKEFCNMLIQEIGPQLEGLIPVSRGQEQREGWEGAVLLPVSHLSHLLVVLGGFLFCPNTSPHQLQSVRCLLWEGGSGKIENLLKLRGPVGSTE